MTLHKLHIYGDTAKAVATVIPWNSPNRNGDVFLPGCVGELKAVPITLHGKVIGQGNLRPDKDGLQLEAETLREPLLNERLGYGGCFFVEIEGMPLDFERQPDGTKKIKDFRLTGASLVRGTCPIPSDPRSKEALRKPE